jgi:hypothetical protein
MIAYLEPTTFASHQHDAFSQDTFNIILPSFPHLQIDLLYWRPLKSCTFSACKSSPQSVRHQHNRLLSVSDFTHQIMMHLSRHLLFLSVHPASQDILARFQATGRDGYVTFVLDMDCDNATALLQEVRSNALPHSALSFHTISYFSTPGLSHSFISHLNC